MILSENSIKLNPTEEQFVALLDDFAGRQDPPVECRIAGGWVRDKLLDLPSSDLDVALNIPSGWAFATEFVDYLHAKGVHTGSVGRVAANPEQSKHLETGTTTILGLDCDFVGLRSESYADSRIPHLVELGTPLDDALRRDLTINSLFYNVHTHLVEDHTRLGLEDLSARIARTPLPPRQTFFDDPLRVLRCVRFAARFGLEIEEGVAEAARDPEIQAAVKTKVSRERIGIEIGKMLSPSKDPLRALTLIDQLHLHSSIFTIPPTPACPVPVSPPREDSLRSAQILSHVSQRKPFSEWIDSHLWLAAALEPFRGLTWKGKKEMHAVSAVISEDLKLSTKVNDAVTHLVDMLPILNPLATGRSEIGVVLQHPSVRPWQRSVVWGAVTEILGQWDGEWTDEADKIVAKWADFVGRIEQLGLPDAIDRPLLLDGKEAETLLELRPGPIVGVIRAAVNAWQLDHPDATVDECAAWLKGMWEGQGRVEWEAALPPVQVKGKQSKSKQKDAKAEKRKR